jgi:hypothetical protein
VVINPKVEGSVVFHLRGFKMPHQARTSQVQNNGYHQSNSLLFQFILSDLMQAHRIVQETNRLANRWKQSSNAPFAQSVGSKFFLLLKTSVNKLVGSSQDYMRIFSWSIENGILAKLKNNCGFFTQNSHSDDKNALVLQRYANNTWLLCLRCLDIIRAIEHDALLDVLGKAKPLGYYSNVLFQTLEKMTLSMQRFSRILIRLLFTFKEDENVIFFLLRCKEELDSLYGINAVIKLLEQMYPGGLQEVGHFLSKKYASRGFDNLLPVIANKIAELEVCKK